MSKGKKFIIAIIVFAAILVGTVYGLTKYSASVPNTSDGISYLDEEKKEEDTKYPVLEKSKSFGNAGYVATDNAHKYYLPALKKADSKYIWIDRNGEIWGVSKKKLQSNMMASDEEHQLETYLTDVNTIMSLAENITYNFTSGYNQSYYKGSPAYWKFWNGGDYIEAFGTVLPKDEEFSDQNHNDNPLAERGLKLKLKNIEVEKVMCSDEYVANYSVVVQVSADVTCKKKSEVFEELDWLPEVGETKHLTFVYYNFIDDQIGGRMFPKNIIVS